MYSYAHFPNIFSLEQKHKYRNKCTILHLAFDTSCTFIDWDFASCNFHTRCTFICAILHPKKPYWTFKHALSYIVHLSGQLHVCTIYFFYKWGAKVYVPFKVYNCTQCTYLHLSAYKDAKYGMGASLHLQKFRWLGNLGCKLNLLWKNGGYISAYMYVRPRSPL